MCKNNQLFMSLTLSLAGELFGFWCHQNKVGEYAPWANSPSSCTSLCTSTHPVQNLQIPSVFMGYFDPISRFARFGIATEYIHSAGEIRYPVHRYNRSRINQIDQTTRKPSMAKKGTKKGKKTAINGDLPAEGLNTTSESASEEKLPEEAEKSPVNVEEEQKGPETEEEKGPETEPNSMAETHTPTEDTVKTTNGENSAKIEASEPEKSAVVPSNTPEPSLEVSTPALSPPKSKKRLTLQERLALAAKGKKKTGNVLSPITSREVVAKEEPKIESVEKEAPETRKEETGQKNDAFEAEVKALRAQVLELQDDNRRLKLTAPKLLSFSDKEKKELLAKLSIKDDTIKQLLAEGEALSLKELKLNDSIKALKMTNSELEASLREYAVKNEEALLQLSELEDVLTVHKFKSLEQLLEKFGKQQQELSSISNIAEKNAHFEEMYNDQKKQYEAEVNEKKAVLKELSECRIQMDILKKQAALETDSKEQTITNIKKEVLSLKEEHAGEVARLESKLELLRLQSEQQPTVSEKNEAKSVDYEAYAKLSGAHHSLQQQYLSSQENWKIIELNLLGKVDALTESTEALKRTKMKAAQEQKKAQTQLSSQQEELNKLREEVARIAKERDAERLSLQVKNADFEDLHDKFDRFKEVYNTERLNLQTKIKSLEQERAKEKEVLPPIHPKEVGLNISLPQRSLSVENSTSNITSPGWDIRLGESSTTPAMSKDLSGIFMDASRNLSNTSFADDSYEAMEDSFLFHSRAPPTSNGGGNIQLVHKMSANIRRLEVEINTLKDENTQLLEQKEQAQRALLQSQKSYEDKGILQEKMASLEADLEERKKKELTLLEILGEKSEQVEELQADVQDLKDLCRQQVQQMVGMQ